jgi:hypothetical protein
MISNGLKLGLSLEMIAEIIGLSSKRYKNI